MAGQPLPSDNVDDHRRPTGGAPADLAVYTGCWLALIDGRVAGVGLTPEAARQAARRSRPRERIGQVCYVPPAAEARQAEVSADDPGT